MMTRALGAQTTPELAFPASPRGPFLPALKGRPGACKIQSYRAHLGDVYLLYSVDFRAAVTHFGHEGRTTMTNERDHGQTPAKPDYGAMWEAREEALNAQDQPGMTPAEIGERAALEDWRVEVFTAEALEDGPATPTNGTYVTHLWLRDARGRERHEAGQLGDRNNGVISELDEVLGADAARRARTLEPGQTMIVEPLGPSGRMLTVHRIW